MVVVGYGESLLLGERRILPSDVESGGLLSVALMAAQVGLKSLNTPDDDVGEHLVGGVADGGGDALLPVACFFEAVFDGVGGVRAPALGVCAIAFEVRRLPEAVFSAFSA